MPLLRGIARTAVVAGTATAVSGRVQRRQQRRFAAKDAPPEQDTGQQDAEYDEEAAPPPVPEQRSAPSTADTLEQLKQLGELKEQGVLTESEFAVQKEKILHPA
ncbi:MAG TPA: SHOCT domain-containing protein [Blastococcus sp.]|jgi:hypothetical protein|nr:SHOCT domain-containing protein [Blastococcus sp.]